MRPDKNFFLYPNSARTLVIFLFFIPLILFSQQNTILENIDELIRETEKAYGPDDLLVNGILYLPDHPQADGNPYFRDEQWKNGRIVIRGRSFEHVKMIYNAELDRVIIQSGDSSQNTMTVLLNQDLIDEFSLDGHHFINLGLLSLADNRKGFAEEIYRSGLTFIVIHKKTFLREYSRSNQFGRYSKLQSVKYIQSGDQLVKLPTRKSFLSFFEPWHDQVIKYMRTNKIRYRKASERELYGLLKYCDELKNEK